MTKLILASLFLSSFSWAFSAENYVTTNEDQKMYLPLFPRRASDFNQLMFGSGRGEPDWSTSVLTKYAKVRIKIFPHNGRYATPHGPDAIMKQIKFTSTGNCNIWRADRPTSEGSITRNKLISSGKSFVFSTTNLKQPVWVDCVELTTMTRPSYPKQPVSYHGVMFVKPVTRASGAKYITVVNVLPLEQYLKGVVPSEMPASWSAEALKAQAIAARSYALYELATNVGQQDSDIVGEAAGAQFDDTVMYQAYSGRKNMMLSTSEAVDATAGQTMIHNGKLVKAYFHADSGGYTENAENVWGKAFPYILAKKELYAEGAVPGVTWSHTQSLSQTSKELIQAKMLPAGASIIDIDIDPKDYYPSGRPSHIQLTLAGGTVKKMLAVDFAFGVRVKSQWIKTTVDKVNKTVTIDGRGHGHGAGMNQWGAKALVETLNMSGEEILKFYYTGIKITDKVK